MQTKGELANWASRKKRAVLRSSLASLASAFVRKAWASVCVCSICRRFATATGKIRFCFVGTAD